MQSNHSNPTSSKAPGATGPGKSYRDGISLPELFALFPDNETAERWFVETRWPNGVACPCCGSLNVQPRPRRKPQPFRCRDCRHDFSVKTGTLMEGSKIGLATWAVALYIMTTGIKGTSSMKIRRDLRITQKSAWFLAHRIREAWRDNSGGPFDGPVESDESYFGGKNKNRHARKRKADRSDKTIVVGVKDRKSGKIRAAVVPRPTEQNILGVVADSTRGPDVQIYTDESPVYAGLENHETVNHSVGQYVDGKAHTNGLESFWSLMKRGYHGTYHKMSRKHLPRYVAEFAGRHNDRPLGTLEQMRRMVRGMEGKRLRYRDLIAKVAGVSAVAT